MFFDNKWKLIVRNKKKIIILLRYLNTRQMKLRKIKIFINQFIVNKLVLIASQNRLLKLLRTYHERFVHKTVTLEKKLNC